LHISVGCRKQYLFSLLNSPSSLLNYYYNYYYNCFMALWILSMPTWVSRYQKGKTNLDLLELEIVGGSGINWAICKFAPCPRQITTPASHHSFFYRLDALPVAKLTASKH